MGNDQNAGGGFQSDRWLKSRANQGTEVSAQGE
jgi:hypothetical protein